MTAKPIEVKDTPIKSRGNNTEPPKDMNDLINKMSVATAINATDTPDNPQSNIELTNKVVDTLFDMVKRKMLGIMTNRQISGIKKLYLVNDIIFDNRKSVLTRIIENEIDLSVSVNGKGREQLVKLTRVEDQTEQSIGRIKRFLG
ncbi:hypothetical protein KAX97_05330 [candidate division WOR-3 bacterium]|nr:hypothetical protein [candidate division WOR-3 bacterium]